MTKKESEFSKTLDDLDRKSSEINHEKKVRIARDKRIETTLQKHEAEKERLKKVEEEIVKKENAKNKVFYLALAAILGITILVPYYREDPVNFWFYVVVGLCYVGFYVTYKSSR